MEISSQTGALYQRAANATDLASIYATYAAEIRGMDSYPEASGSLERGASAEHKVLVDSYTTEQTFVLHWPWVDKAFTLRLKRPDGTFLPAGAAGVEIAQKDRHFFYRVQKPKPGTWTMVVTASRKVKSDQKTIGYRVQALAKAPGLSCKVAPHRFFNKPGQPVVIHAFVSAAGLPVARAEVTGIVTPPSGKPFEIKLADDGDAKLSGDEKANDGVYTARFDKTDAVGSYQIALKINAKRPMTATPDEIDPKWKPAPLKPFVRQATSSFMVGRQEVKPPKTEKTQ
jgi:hypothetical protein